MVRPVGMGAGKISSNGFNMGLRALYSSISGVQSNSSWLDVIGNNISNVNTVAYKTSRVEFADQFSQTLFAGSGADAESGQGGMDSQQIGLGTRLGSIQTLFDQGPTFTTGVSTDISIQGDGFLVSQSGSTTYLTRAGNLSFDSQGYLVDQNGGLIQGVNASTQYTQKPILSAIPFIPPNPLTGFPGYGGNAPLFITDASLKLNPVGSQNLSAIKIDRDMVLPPKATTVVDFKGNLDSFQQANILDLAPGGIPILPVAVSIQGGLGPPPPPFPPIDTTRMTTQPTAGGGFTLAQVQNLSTFTPGVFQPPQPLENEFTNIRGIKGAVAKYAWDFQPPIPPAHQMSETVYDSLGNPRQITVQFYQVNDLGQGGINNPAGPSQVCYAWYAFETTGGQPVSTQNLLGGTGIGEGDPAFYDRGVPGQAFFGDFVWFNTDGSLASSGGVGGFNGPPGLNFNFQVMPRLYLPPVNLPLPAGDVSAIPTTGSEIMAVDLNFGTFGLLGQGKRDGIYSDAEGSYQVVNGKQTYVPKSTAYAASQDGYSDGILQGVNFDNQGNIIGSFDNGQKVSLAQVALDQVENPDGLNKVGSNYYTTSVNSGSSHLGLAGQGNFGKIQGSSLEGSNVDLTVELSNMIVAQRSFEVNARMVSVVNDTLNVINNLGR